MLYSTIRRELFRSLHKKYKSDIQTSKSTLLIYFNNPVGIGEHPQHLEEMDILLENMTSAHDKLEILHRYFKDDNFKIQFNEAQLAVTPGQSIVFYINDILIGGGIIEL